MAKLRKRRKMSITAKYNRLAIGMLYYGEEAPTKKRATRKQYEQLNKKYQKLRKKLKAEGLTSLPTIAQAYKYIQEQKETQFIPKSYLEPRTTADIEPLPYANELEAPNIDFASGVIDQFITMLNDAVNEAMDMWKGNYKVINTITKLQADILQTLNTLRTEIGEENLATQLNNNVEYDRLIQVLYMNYGDFILYLDNILSDLKAIVKDVEDSKKPFVPQTNINLENI